TGWEGTGGEGAWTGFIGVLSRFFRAVATGAPGSGATRRTAWHSRGKATVRRCPRFRAGARCPRATRRCSTMRYFRGSDIAEYRASRRL
ncbi:hypothetical protein, partial [Robbsia andropogonis]|uniref:hypothetical protein n=1 Tax=Robbsia andropogonis TaxID=28092 RepID=UPI001C929AAF